MKSRFFPLMLVSALLFGIYIIISWPSQPAKATPPRPSTIQLTIDSGGNRSAYPHSFVNFKGESYFGVADDQGGFWKSDGTADGTEQVKQLYLAYDTFIGRRGDGPIFTTSDYIFFLASESNPKDPSFEWDEIEPLSLWRSDGTTDGTIKLYELDSPSFSGISLTIFQNLLHFTPIDETYGRELWRSDGTVVGTTLVADINPGEESSFPDNFTIWNDKLYFSANDGENGRNIWETDGSQAGTRLAVETGQGIHQLVVANNALYFTTWNQGPSGHSGGSLLWQSDGTTAGTNLIESSYPAPIGMTVVADKLLYNAENPAFSNDNPYWISDGTPSGTIQILDDKSRYSRDKIVTEKHVYLAAVGPNGFSTWRTDGTITGTVEFTSSLRIPSYQSESAVDGESIYYTGHDTTHGYELWHSDGTITGTRLITDIVPSLLRSRDTYAYPAPIHVTDNGILFGVNDGTLGKELWKSDG